MRDFSIKKKASHLIFTLYVVMVMTLLGSLCVSLYQNWHLKLQSSQDEMARQAGIGNVIIEHATVNAAKALGNAQQALQKIMVSRTPSTLQVHEILQNSLEEHNAYINSDYQGLMLFIDAEGLLQARTDHYPAERLDFSDRAYFQHLRQQPELDFIIGPLVRAQTTGEWVFHVATPLRDARKTFRGVLAQQIRLADIAQDVRRYIDRNHPVQIVTQTLDGYLALVYPPQLASSMGDDGIHIPYADFARRSSTPQDSFIWPVTPNSAGERLVVGYEISEHFHFLTTAHRTLASILIGFIEDSLFLISITVAALLLLSLMVVRLNSVYDQFAGALHDSYSDALTQLPNRRAMQDMFPRLLREGMRSQQPLSVLFIDIDLFKRFNDDYGHDGGDIALKAVAQVLQSCAKRPLDFVCRWGGEEFVAILPHTSLQAAVFIAKDMLQSVRSIQLCDDLNQPMRQVSVSIGIANSALVSDSQGELLINDADHAMQAAKKAGRDRYVVARTTDT
jgi:diguanylate cyclase (GGDEF)-like protein